MVPMGCGSVTTTVVKNPLPADMSRPGTGYGNAGTVSRGTATAVAPSKGNGYRGELLISDPFPGSEVMDATVTLTCQGTARPPQPHVRLSCVHIAGASGDGMGAESCKMGRVEVWNPRIKRDDAPSAGEWGTVCAAMGRKVILLLTAPFQ
jgi:hypothetical protein